MSKLIYQSKYTWTNPFTLIIMLLTIIQIVLVVVLLCMLIKNYIVGALIILAIIYLFYRMLKGESIFRIYDDKIDFLNTVFDERIFKSISFSDVIQVRYEDSFSDGSPDFSIGNFAQIYLYLKMNSESDKIIIKIVQRKNREQILINILKVFKEKNIEIFVSTKYKRLLKELELKNWTAP